MQEHDNAYIEEFKHNHVLECSDASPEMHSTRPFTTGLLVHTLIESCNADYKQVCVLLPAKFAMPNVRLKVSLAWCPYCRRFTV